MQYNSRFSKEEKEYVTKHHLRGNYKKPVAPNFATAYLAPGGSYSAPKWIFIIFIIILFLCVI